jgi:predicted anti-sigma-YlaC factor YlaD
MNCPSQLMCSLYIDGALESAENATLEHHIETCASCAALVSALAAESRMLRGALQAAEEAVVVPELTRPLGATDVLALGAGATLVAWLVAAVWRGLLSYVPAELSWLNPLDLGGLWDLFVNSVLFFAHEGNSMIGSAMTSASFAVALAFGAWGLFGALKRRQGTSVLLSVLLLVIVMPSLAHAIEIRRDAGLASVPAGETVNDTLVVFGESVAIDGNVNGDLIAFTRTLTVRGDVAGDVVGFGQTLAIEGSVGGTVYGFGRTVDVRAPVGRNLFGFGSDVTIGDSGAVGGNATLFANNAVMRGRVGIDLTTFASDLEVSGEVVRDVEANAQRVRVVAPARIGGDLRSRVGAEADVQVAAGATIGGARDVEVTERREQRNKYLTGSFYVRQVLRVAAAFAAGLVLLWIFPSLRTLTLDSGGDVLKASGIGFAAVFLLPILSLILAITIIGIPLALVGFVLWVVGLYFSKIIVALLVGRRLFVAPSGNVPHHAALLIAGLVIVVIAVNLPYVGGLLNFLLVLLGVGLLVMHFAGRSERRYV